MSKFGITPTEGSTEFGNDPNVPQCIQYTLTIALLVNYTKIRKYITLKPPTLGRWEWDGEVELKLTLNKEELTSFKCPPYIGAYDKKCPPLCETTVLYDKFVGEKCGKSNNSILEFVKQGSAPKFGCSPVQDCPRLTQGVAGAGKPPPKCVGLYNLKCKKLWNTCGEDPGLKKYFSDGNTKTINLGGKLPDKASASVAWRLLESAAKWKIKTPGAGDKSCRICEFLCCLAKGMIEGGGTGAGCNMEDCHDLTPYSWPLTKKECEKYCAVKWAAFIFDGPCDPDKVDSDTSPDIFSDQYSSSTYYCPGCCVE